jgi:hypothetical protein
MVQDCVLAFGFYSSAHWCDSLAMSHYAPLAGMAVNCGSRKLKALIYTFGTPCAVPGRDALVVVHAR